MGNFGKFGGSAGGGMNMNLIKQAQQMQQQMLKAQEELQSMTFEGISGGGVVKVTIDGAKKVIGVSIDKQAVDMDDLSMLEDLVVLAANDAQDKQEQQAKSTMGAFGNMGGLL